MDTTFTVPEFNQQICEFRKLMGDKRFWAKPESERDIAVRAIGHVYLSLEPSLSTDAVNRCATVLSSTLEEYSRRQLFMLTAKLETA